MRHEYSNIVLPTGEGVSAIAPVIVSVSRATDIPAFYADWFFNRLEAGYVKWRNPFNSKDSYVSFAQTRFIVFWSKNPQSLISKVSFLRERNIGFYIQFTLNDYQEENLEPNLPSLDQRIATFKYLSQMVGRDSVIWRFDPLILSDSISIDKLINKINFIGDQLLGYTNKFVFSFADIGTYKKVYNNFIKAGISHREWTIPDMLQFSDQLSHLNNSRWNFELATCAEAVDLKRFGISHNSCIDPHLIGRLAIGDETLQQFLQSAKVDTGQRPMCGCILSKDIGAYNTCPHGCIYCYANTSQQRAQFNYQMHKNQPYIDSII